MLHLLTIEFPNISPIALRLGPLDIRWYGLAYAVGLVAGWAYVRSLLSTSRLWPAGQKPFPDDLAIDMLLYSAIGVFVGGRLGAVLLYEPGYYWHNLEEVPAVWHGGMAFHGAVIGTGLALLLLARRRHMSALTLIDLCTAAAPIGLFLGRLANFINAELWGHVSTMPWAMVFPGAGPQPRHPSQLYEALTEGLLLFLVLRHAIYARSLLGRPGMVTGIFLVGYAIARIFCEFFREDTDPQIGLGILTSGQMYSLPMVLVGIGIMVWARRQRSDALAG